LSYLYLEVRDDSCKSFECKDFKLHIKKELVIICAGSSQCFTKAYYFLQDVLLYSIVEQTGETEPFYMAPSTGVITLRQLLTGSTKTIYRVR
jgi:hypothetical protein